MRLLLIICTLFTSLISFSQNQGKNDTTTNIAFAEVVNADSVSKDDIYKKSMLWVADNFKDSKSAIRVSDKEAGVINGHASFTMKFNPNPKNDNSRFDEFTFTWTIDIKNSKSRFSIYDIIYNWGGSYLYPLTNDVKCPYYGFKSKAKMNEEWALFKIQFSKEMHALIANYSLSINKKNENW